MKNKQNNDHTPFSEACLKILAEFPVAIGVAYNVLDCGCALLCGMTAAGDPVGALQHISGQPIKKGARIPICLKCKKDNGFNRVVWEGIYWPGSQQEWPDKDIRIAIGREAFGPGYREAE